MRFTEKLAKFNYLEQHCNCNDAMFSMLAQSRSPRQIRNVFGPQRVTLYRGTPQFLGRPKNMNHLIQSTGIDCQTATAGYSAYVDVYHAYTSDACPSTALRAFAL